MHLRQNIALRIHGLILAGHLDDVNVAAFTSLAVGDLQYTFESTLEWLRFVSL